MELRPYQAEIIDSVLTALRDGGSGQILMACGSGKTLVGLRCAEDLLGPGGTVAILVPSLALAAQTLRSWSMHTRRHVQVLAVCSDDTVADASTHVADLPAPVTTDPARIEAWLRRPAHGIRLVVCTYASAGRLKPSVPPGR